MNCKPGDIAVIVGANDYAGMLVEVLYLAPVGVLFDLPNGRPHQIVETSSAWVIKSMGSKFQIKMKFGFIANQYAVGDDKYLRPIRPGDLHETEDDLNEVSA